MLRYVFLGLVQGLTEFLPVSSSAHLLLLRGWLGLEEPGPLLVAFFHLGTLLALVIWFWRDLLWLASAFVPQGKKARRYLGLLVAGLIPVIVLALIFGENLERMFSVPRLASALLFLTALLLFLADRAKEGEGRVPKVGQALLIGLAQAAAILPGLSRSGATVTTGLFLGLRRDEAFRFSFLLGIPTFVGSFLFTVRQGSAAENWVGLTVGTLTAFVFGVLGLALFRSVLLRRSLWPFSLYCLLLGIAGLILG